MLWSTESVSDMCDELVELEAEISALRCRQHVVVNELDKVNAAAGDGYRSSVDWLSALLDVERSTASDLVLRLAGRRNTDRSRHGGRTG